MSTTPFLTHELARSHEQELLGRAAWDRCVAVGAASSLQRRALTRVGSLLIAAGERLGGIRPTAAGEIARAAR